MKKSNVDIGTWSSIVASLVTLFLSIAPVLGAEFSCPSLFSSPAQISNSDIFRIASNVRSERLGWEVRKEGEYDTHDLATIISKLSLEQKGALLREIPAQFSGNPIALKIIKRGCGDLDTWKEWVSDVRKGEKFLNHLRIDLILLFSLPAKLQNRIINALRGSFSDLSKEGKSNPALISPRRAVTYVLLAATKPYDIFMKNPQRPDLAFIEFFDRMGQLTGGNIFNGRQVLEFLKEVKKALGSVGDRSGLLLYGSITNGTINRNSDIDFIAKENGSVRALLYHAARNVLGHEFPIRDDLHESYSFERVQFFASDFAPLSIEIQKENIIFWVNPHHSKSYTSSELYNMKSRPFVLSGI